MGNSILELQQLGQSVWLDSIYRAMFRTGKLTQLIDADGLRGMTSNPTIFQKALSTDSDYDEALRQLAESGKSVAEITDTIIIQDIQTAADQFMPLYRGTHGADGYVSIEVNPRLAYDTHGTIAEVRRLADLVQRPNVMIKIPGTREGLPAIRQMLAEGYNINITLLFSIDRYEEVAEAYVSALEQRVTEEKTIDAIASVASFFVSRVDTVVDKLLEKKIGESATREEAARLESLLGQAAVANAKVAYQRFKTHFKGERFGKLSAVGARAQRVLWASTGAKNPRYRDVKYVEELIGPETVNTMPEQTFESFKDHGQLATTLDRDVERAEEILRDLAIVGIDMKQITDQLETDGVLLFEKSFAALLDAVSAKTNFVRASDTSG